MALKKIRVVWPTPPLPEGRWRLGLFHLAQSVDPSRPLPPGGVPSYWKGYLHHTLTLSVRGLLCWGGMLAVVAYFAAAGLLLARHERANPHNRVGYWDLALPHRWKERPRLQGEGFILLARDKLAEQRFHEGFALLRLGVERVPNNYAARLDLARIYVALRLRGQAEKLLREGLTHGYPGRDYLEVALALAEEGDRPDVWLELCQLAGQQLAVTPSAPTADAAWLDKQTVRAYAAANRQADAVAYVAERYPDTDPFRREITLLGLFAEKKSEDAVRYAARWAKEAPRAPEPLRLLARAHREAGDFNAMESALTRLREQDPAKPDALFYALTQNHLAGRPEAVREARDELVFRHGARPAVLVSLSAVYAELGLRDEIDRVETEMRGRGMPLAGALIARLQADIVARDWNAALVTADRLRSREAGPLSETQSIWLDTMRRLVLACADGGSGNQAALVEAIADRPGTLRLYRLTLDSLLSADRVDTAAKVLALAEGPYPSARGVIAARARIEAEQAEQTAARQPTASTADPAKDPLAGPGAFDAAFLACIKNQDTDAALALLASARRARPAWVIDQEARLDALELPLRARGDDPLRLQLLVRNTLSRDASAPANLLDLAVGLHAEGAKGNALLIVKEILRRDPGQAAALARLAEWEPRPRGGALDVAP